MLSNLDKAKILSFCKGLNKRLLTKGQHWGKRREFWKPRFSPFPTMFSNFPRTNFEVLHLFICKSFQFGQV